MAERDIFLAAIDLPDPAARAAYVAAACAGDAGLRGRVEALLRSHEAAGSFLGTPAAAGPDAAHDKTLTYDPSAPPADDYEGLPFLSPPQRPDSLGRIGHYEVLQVLGKGGFGIVFRAHDDLLQRVVAVKVLAPQLAATSPARKRFLREARTSAAVRHENVVQVYEVAEHPLPYLAMEFIPGETLQQKLDRSGPLDAAEVCRIGRQIAEGLAAAHATDLIHRDIKPANVLIEGGPRQQVKITDFGLARAADDASISQSGIIAGTPMYMAPEQALGYKLDQRADLFSLGSVLYQMAAGRAPFRATGTVAVLKRVAEDTPRDIREIIPETPQWLCDIVAKLHAKNPADRYQSAREVADVLADCEAQLKAHAKLKDYSRIPRVNVKSPAPGTSKWKWAAAAALLLPVVALAATEIAGVTHLFRSRQPTDPVNPDTQPGPVDGTPDPDGWVQLFNGKDLSGWKTHPVAGGDWRVENGVIDGRGATSYLFHESGGFANFHLRVEAKVNAAGDAGVYVRAPFDVQPLLNPGPAKYALPGGYEAAIAVRPSYPTHTGSLTASDGATLAAGPLKPHRPEEWFVLEVIAEDNRLRTLVDGTPTADYRDDKRRHARGHVALQTWGPGITHVRFRKVEIKELPETPSPPAGAPFADADAKRIAALPAAEQVEEVRKELVRRNPGFDGKVEHKIEGDALTEFGVNTDAILDIAPVRALSGLVYLDLRGTYPNKGKLIDLSPLKGMKLSRLDCSSTQIADLRPLTDVPLTTLHVNHNPVSDLTPLKGMKLESLGIAETKVSDLTPLKGMKIKVLGAQLLPVTDLSPLEGMPLTGIDLYHTIGVTKLDALKGMPLGDLNLQDVPVKDLTPLKGMATLRSLHLVATDVSDLSPLAGLKLTDLVLSGKQIIDLAPLKGMSLVRLHFYGTGVRDLRPLQGIPLEEIRFNPKAITQGLDVLRDMKSLKTIGIDGDKAWPAAGFWARYDKGEFKE